LHFLVAPRGDARFEALVEPVGADPPEGVGVASVGGDLAVVFLRVRVRVQGQVTVTVSAGGGGREVLGLTRRRRCTSGGVALRPWELVGGGGALGAVW